MHNNGVLQVAQWLDSRKATLGRLTHAVQMGVEGRLVEGFYQAGLSPKEANYRLGCIWSGA
jgi:hypothetical protein